MGKKPFWGFLRDQYSTNKPVVQADLSDKTVVVIGANTGIGFEATKHFAAMGAGRLILGCRSKSRGEDALKRLNYPKAELRLIDLASFQSTKDFAQAFERDEKGIDIMVLNAGVNPWNALERTKDGWETTIQTNDISPAYLAFSLLPAFKRASERTKQRSRLVVVASDMHFWNQFDKETLNSPKILDKLNDPEYFKNPAVAGTKRYGITKLINVLFARHFADYLPATKSYLTVNSVNPGLCATELARDAMAASVINRIVVKIFYALLAKTSEEGSRQLVWAALASDEENPNLSGAYINCVSIEEPSDFVIGKDGERTAKRLWDETVGIIEGYDSNVREVLAST